MILPKFSLCLMLFYPLLRHLAILRRNINPDIITLEIYRGNCRRTRTHKWVQNNSSARGRNYSVNQAHRKSGRMIVIHLLRKLPNITMSVCFFSKFKFWLSYKINNFISWQEIPWIEIKATFSFPNYYLANRKSMHDVLAILQ